MMEIRKEIFLQSQGSITQLPDSQKIFGKFIYEFSEKCGYLKARKFVNLIKEKKIFCMVSSLYPKGYIFTPFIETEDKGLYQNMKRKKFVKLKKGLEKKDLNISKLNEVPYITLEKYFQQRSGVTNQRNNMNYGYENELFSISYEVYKTNVENKIIDDFIFNIYIKYEEDDKNLVREFIKVINDLVGKEYQSFGKRASQGYNVYKIYGICDIDNQSQDTSYYLNLGMLIPNFDVIDLENSILKIFTSERRPYSKMGLWNKKEFIPYFISFVIPGSIIKLKNGKNIQEVGNCIESVYDESKDSIIFGNSYLISIGR